MDEKIGQKFDEGKLLMNLIPPSLVFNVSQVLTFGAQKYAPNNWRLVPNALDRYQNATLRHLYAYLSGEELDKESGLPHLAHCATNIAFLIELENELLTKRNN